MAPGMEDHKKQPLGKRAFFLFFLKRTKFLWIFGALAFGAWYAERWIAEPYLAWESYVAEILAIIVLGIFLMILMRTFLEYHYYTYTFADHAFVVTQGYIVRDEVATLYHQIQNVNIKRSPLDRLAGVSQVIILMSGGGHERQSNHIVIPALGKRKASMVQQELLARARRQHEAPMTATLQKQTE